MLWFLLLFQSISISTLGVGVGTESADIRNEPPTSALIVSCSIRVKFIGSNLPVLLFGHGNEWCCRSAVNYITVLFLSLSSTEQTSAIDHHICLKPAESFAIARSCGDKAVCHKQHQTYHYRHQGGPCSQLSFAKFFNIFHKYRFISIRSSAFYQIRPGNFRAMKLNNE